MREKIVAGNWKMNTDLTGGHTLASEVINMYNDEVQDNVTAIIIPPFTHLASVVKLASGSKVKVGAQNCHWEKNGAFTGEISAEMLASIDATYVVIGHSERREYFNETDDLLKKKVDAALKEGLIPIFCCGESLDTREKGDPYGYVKDQISAGLFHLDKISFSKVVIAYEPIWAIGTGRTASSEQAQQMHEAIRGHLADKYGGETAENCSILYGGSCKPGNAREIFSGKDVDGGLIGGASLKSRDFIDIINSL